MSRYAVTVAYRAVVAQGGVEIEQAKDGYRVVEAPSSAVAVLEVLRELLDPALRTVASAGRVTGVSALAVREVGSGPRSAALMGADRAQIATSPDTGELFAIVPLASWERVVADAHEFGPCHDACRSPACELARGLIAIDEEVARG